MCLESLMQDAIARNVMPAVLNDIVPGAAQQWVWSHAGYDLIAVFDDLLVTRRRNSHVWRIIRPNAGPLGQHAFGHFRDVMEHATQLGCHGSGKEEASNFLMRFIAATGNKRRPPDALN
jgi:hypothetical protein